MLGMLMLAAGLVAMGPILEGAADELAKCLPALHGGG
jgi:hypothetical protein